MVSPGDALVLAAREGDADAARDLLSSDPSLDACELDDETAHDAAASRGFAPVVAALLDAGANPDRAPRPVDAAAAGDTPLLAALRGDHPEIVEALVAAGADPTRRGGADGVTPLDLAARAPEGTPLGNAARSLAAAAAKSAAERFERDAEDRMSADAAAREAARERAMRDVETRLATARSEREGKIRALKAENEELRRKYGLR